MAVLGGRKGGFATDDIRIQKFLFNRGLHGGTGLGKFPAEPVYVSGRKVESASRKRVDKRTDTAIDNNHFKAAIALVVPP